MFKFTKNYKTIQDFFEDFIKQYQREYPGKESKRYKHFISTVGKEISKKADDFKKDIEKQKALLDNTPLTRKDYEKKMADINRKTDIFKRFENEIPFFEHNKIITFYFVKLRLKQHRIEDEEFLDSLFKYIWENLDFHAMRIFFDEERYEKMGCEVGCEENSCDYTEHNLYNYNSNSLETDYEGNLLNHIINLKIDIYNLSK